MIWLLLVLSIGAVLSLKKAMFGPYIEKEPSPLEKSFTISLGTILLIVLIYAMVKWV